MSIVPFWTRWTPARSVPSGAAALAPRSTPTKSAVGCPSHASAQVTSTVWLSRRQSVAFTPFVTTQFHDCQPIFGTRQFTSVGIAMFAIVGARISAELRMTAPSAASPNE